jgi:excisionase family DNA binding protein
MTLLTIEEAAQFLRLTKRTLYQRADIPRVRYGHRLMFVKEDLEKWIRMRSVGHEVDSGKQEDLSPTPVDAGPSNVYHRNPLFVLSRHR